MAIHLNSEDIVNAGENNAIPCSEEYAKKYDSALNGLRNARDVMRQEISSDAQ
jgi:hypothetical protein